MTRRLPKDRSPMSSQTGLPKNEIAARFEIWLSDLESFPAVELPMNAADELRRAYADGDV